MSHSPPALTSLVVRLEIVAAGDVYVLTLRATPDSVRAQAYKGGSLIVERTPAPPNSTPEAIAIAAEAYEAILLHIESLTERNPYG